MHHTMKQEESWTEFMTDMSQNVNTPERVVSALAGGALVGYGLKRGGVLGAAASVLGGGMLIRGTTGHCHVYDAAGIDTAHQEGSSSERSPYGKSILSGVVHVTKSATINRSPAEIYQFWRNFTNLPNFMTHLESVEVTGDLTSHWKARSPFGGFVDWDAVLTSDQENERIGWQSTEGSEIVNSGTVQFRPTIDRGTEVRVDLTYESPGGKVGSWLAWMLGEEPGQQVGEDLRRLKMLMESGEIITIEGQTSGRAEMPKAMTARA